MKNLSLHLESGKLFGHLHSCFHQLLDHTLGMLAEVDLENRSDSGAVALLVVIVVCLHAEAEVEALESGVLENLCVFLLVLLKQNSKRVGILAKDLLGGLLEARHPLVVGHVGDAHVENDPPVEPVGLGIALFAAVGIVALVLHLLVTLLAISRTVAGLVECTILLERGDVARSGIVNRFISFAQAGMLAWPRQET